MLTEDNWCVDVIERALRGGGDRMALAARARYREVPVLLELNWRFLFCWNLTGSKAKRRLDTDNP
jgi:hypothetical protein